MTYSEQIKNTYHTEELQKSNLEIMSAMKGNTPENSMNNFGSNKKLKNPLQGLIEIIEC